MDSYEEIARKRVEEKKKFYQHRNVYLVIGGFFLALNLLTSPGTWWFYWPMLGWGIGLGIQYMKVFGFPGSGAGSDDWEEREMAKEMRRLAPEEPYHRDELDDHLELREVRPEKVKQDAGYRKDDLV